MKPKHLFLAIGLMGLHVAVGHAQVEGGVMGVTGAEMY